MNARLKTRSVVQSLAVLVFGLVLGACTLRSPLESSGKVVLNLGEGSPAGRLLVKGPEGIRALSAQDHIDAIYYYYENLNDPSDSGWDEIPT